MLDACLRNKPNLNLSLGHCGLQLHISVGSHLQVLNEGRHPKLRLLLLQIPAVHETIVRAKILCW